MCKDTVCLLAGQKRLQDNYKVPDMLPKVNKADMPGMMAAIKEYLRSHCGVGRAPLACIIRKTIIVWTFNAYPRYATADDEMIPKMLHLPPYKKKLLWEYDTSSVKEHVQNCL